MIFQPADGFVFCGSRLSRVAQWHNPTDPKGPWIVEQEESGSCINLPSKSVNDKIYLHLPNWVPYPKFKPENSEYLRVVDNPYPTTVQTNALRSREKGFCLFSKDRDNIHTAHVVPRSISMNAFEDLMVAVSNANEASENCRGHPSTSNDPPIYHINNTSNLISLGPSFHRAFDTDQLAVYIDTDDLFGECMGEVLFLFSKDLYTKGHVRTTLERLNAERANRSRTSASSSSIPPSAFDEVPDFSEWYTKSQPFKPTSSMPIVLPAAFLIHLAIFCIHKYGSIELKRLAVPEKGNKKTYGAQVGYWDDGDDQGEIDVDEDQGSISIDDDEEEASDEEYERRWIANFVVWQSTAVANAFLTSKGPSREIGGISPAREI